MDELYKLFGIPPSMKNITILIKVLFRMVFANAFASQLQADQTEVEYSSRQEVNFSWANEIYTKTIDSIVTLHQVGEHGQIHGMGTGFFIEKNLIATCYHVVGDSHHIQATLSDNTVISILGVESADKSMDVAILRTEACDVLPLSLVKAKPTVGQPILAIGNPKGLRGSVTPGVISGNRIIDGRDMLQVAVPIEKGNSGGPIVNANGCVFGMLTYKSALTRNLGFAIPSLNIDEIKNNNRYLSIKDWLGVSAINGDLWLPTTKNTWQKKDNSLETNCTGESISGRSICWKLNEDLSGSIHSRVWLNFDDQTGGAGMAFKFEKDQSDYGVFVSEGKLWLVCFNTEKVKDWKILADSSAFGWKRDAWNQLAINRKFNQITCSINGLAILTYNLNKRTNFSDSGLLKLGKAHVAFRALRLTKFDHMPSVYDYSEETGNVDIDDLVQMEDTFKMEMYSSKLTDDLKKLEAKTEFVKIKKIINNLEKLFSKPDLDIFEACVLSAHAKNPNAPAKLIRTMWSDVLFDILVLTNKPSSVEEKIAIAEQYFSEILRWNTVGNSQVNVSHNSVIDVWESREISRLLKKLLLFHIIQNSNNFVENDILLDTGSAINSFLISINPNVRVSLYKLAETLLNQKLTRFDEISILCLDFFISQNYKKIQHLFYRGWIKISRNDNEEGFADWAIVKEMTDEATISELVTHALEFNHLGNYSWMSGIN